MVQRWAQDGPAKHMTQTMHFTSALEKPAVVREHQATPSDQNQSPIEEALPSSSTPSLNTRGHDACRVDYPFKSC